MNRGLFSKLLRKFFGNPFQKVLSGDHKFSGVVNKRRGHNRKPVQVENLEPRLVLSASTSENPLPGLRHEVVFVDSNVPNRQNLVEQIKISDSVTEVVEINASQNGLQQISSYLSGKTNLDAIHVLSHGQQGKLILGSVSIGTNEINSNLDYLATIGRSLTQDGDLLLYGCNISEGYIGQDFVNRLAEVTGADVAASDDATGNILAAGDWYLEQATGPVETTPVVADIGNNTLANYTISIGRNDPKLYYQARSSTPSPASRFTTTYSGWEQYVGANPGPFYVKSYTADNYESYYREVWRDQSVYYPFQGNRTVKVRGYERYSVNVGNGTRFGTQTFTVNAPSTYQIWTTRVAGSIYTDHLGEAKQLGGNNEGPYDGDFKYVTSLYQGSFDPTQPLKNLVAAHETYSFHPQVNTPSYQGEIAYEGELQANTTYVLVVSFAYHWGDEFWYECAPSMLWGDFNVAVTDMNRPPVWDSASLNQTVSGDGVRSFSIPWSKVSDPEGDAITVSARLLVNGQEQNLPSWLTFNPNSMTFSGNAPANTGAINLRLIASDGISSVNKNFVATFTNDNDRPFVATPITGQTWSGSGSFSYQVPVNTFSDSDPSGTIFSYSATLANGNPLPLWLNFDAATRTFSGNPPANATDLNLRVTANDGSGQGNATFYSDFTLKLLNNNDIPTVSGFTKSFAEDNTLSFTSNDFVLADNDTYAAGGVATTGIGKTLQAVRILSLPINGTLWLDANADDLRGNGELVAVNQEIITGDLLKLRFTPDSNWVGSTSFTWSGTDGVNYANSTATASITVSLVNDAPVLALSGGRALALRPNTGNPLVAVTVDPGLTLTDPDTPFTSDAATYDTIYGATVTVVDSTTGNFQSGDVLAATGISGRITVSYNSGSGSLTLSGSATAAEYQQVLRTLAFSSTNTTNDNLRTLSISLKTKDVSIPIVANFDGVDDYIETMRASIPLAGDWTVSVWYRADTAMFSGGRDYTILAQGTSDQNFYISKSGTNNLRLGDSWTVNGGMPNDGDWHQITVVKNGTSSTNGTLYIDGIKISTGQLPNALPGTGMRIGRVYKQDNTQEWGSTYWQGSISDLRVYNRGLNSLEVTDSVNSNTRLTGYESNLVSWYPLDGNADNKAAGSWNLGRDFDPRSPTWLQGPWDLGFIDTGTPLSDFPSSPSGNIFRSIDTSTSDPVISGSTSLTVQTSSDINRGKFVFVRNTVENQVSSTDTIRPGEVFTLANNYSTAAQFTAPMSGIYGVDARFWKVFTNGGGDPKYRVYKLSGSTLSEVDGGGVINATNPSGAAISSLKQIVLDQGDKLIFAVTSNGAVNCDEATLYLHVDLLATKITAGSNTYFYSHSNGHYYGISSSSASWDNAKTAAEALTVGGQSGYLATPTDSASMQIMRAILANANVSGAWAGAKQINSNNEPAGNFYWATGPKAGQPFNGSWNSNEPNDYDHGSGVREHHVEITTGNYNDNNGLLPRPYVVEFGDSRLPLPGELTGTISANRDPGNAMLFKDANVAYSARSGHYYRVDSTARGWNASASAAAQTSYESQTGYLARVTSLNELRIAGWFNRLQNQADQWVGLRQTNKTVEPGGGWQWVTGDEAGMTTDESFATPTFWNASEPNNAWSGTEDYGGMNNYGSGLNDFREVETLGSLVEYGIDGQALSIPLFGFAPNQTVSIKFVSSTALVAVRVGNTAPSASNWSASTSEDTTLSFTAAQFTAGFSDPELDSLASITITALPSASAGVLKFKGVNVTLNQVVLAGELNQLAFVPVADFNGSANFSYTASDGYLSSSAAMVAITVNAVNDRPVLDTAGSPVLATIAEDISSGSNLGTTVSDIVVNGSITDVDVISPSNAPEAIAVTLVDNTNGVWQYKVASGNWTSFSATRDVVSLGASALLLDGTDSIRFLPDANFNGTATFLFRAWDKSSGTAGGTSDPFALGGNTALSVAEETATITVSAVNDAPTTSSKTISFNEDTTYVLTAADFAFADVDAGNTLQSVAITSLPTAGSLTLNNGSADVPVVQSQSISVADITAGKLKFTPVANAFGSSYATMGFTVSDGSASSSPAILTFDVTDTNDAPTAISWASGGNIAENTTSPQGVVVGTLAATDPNTGDVLSFRRTSNPNFSISPDGTVRYVSVVGLDYEITPTQTLGVTVTDSQGLTYSANVTVTVTNASETAPTIKASNFFAALNSLTTITSSNLCAVDEQESGASLVFTIIEQITGGTLWVDTDGDGTVNGSEKVLGKLTPSSPNVANTFTQADIDAGKLKFRKDNTQTAGGLMVSVSDGNSPTQPTKSLLIIPSSPPVVSPIDDQQWRTSGAQSFKVPDNSFLDPDQDILSVSATKSDNSPLPNWLTFDPATWTFSGTPSGVNAGDVLAIKVTATDGRNPAVSDEFNIQFVQTITAPSVSNPISTQTFQGAGSKTFVVPANTFTDPNSATITYGATQANGTSLPSWLSFDPNTRTFSGNPPASAVPGPLWLKVTGTSSGGSASSVFRLNILDANDFPVETPAGTIPDKTLAGDGEHVFTVHRSAFSDPDGATIFLTARTNNNQALPNWLTFSFDNSTGLGTFKADLPSGTGSQIVRVFANDSLGGSGYADFTINYSGGSNAEPLVLTSNGVSGMNNLNPRGLYTISSGNLASFVVNQGTVKAITTQFLMEADPDDQGTGITFTVTTLPQNGQLWIDSDNSNTINGSESALQVGGTFTQADIDSEKLKYRHTANNAISDSFVFTIADGGEDGSIPVTGVTFPITVAPTPSGAPTLLSVGRTNSAPAITNADTLYFRVVFSEDVNRVDAADFALTGTLASSASILAIQAVSGSTYDISVGGAGLANANGTLGIALAANPSITNNNGTGINASVAPLSTVMYTLDNNSPTVSATASVSMHDGSTPFQVTFSFNESVNGISLADFSATNATLGNFVVLYDSNNNPTNQYRITVTPTALQSISVSLAAGAGNDDAGNLTPSASITVLGVITITGPGGSTGSTASVSTPENSTAVHTFSADRSVSWSITGGADASQFTIGSTTGALIFSTAPNFESPSDSNTDNVYVVVIRATDSQNATVDQTISVTVTNVNEAPVISLKREIQETTGLGLTNDHRIYSFYSPENGNAEYGVVIHSPNTGFPDAAAMAAAFQAHPDYNTLPYTITVNGSNTQLVLTFKTDGDFGQRMLQRWGDNGVPLNVLQNGDSNAATIAETNAGLTANGTLSVEDQDLANTVTVTVASVVASGTTTGLAANNAGLLAMFSVNDPNTVISSTTTTGTVTWAFNSGSETFDYLAAGESLTLTYTVRVTDSASVSADRTVTIIIMGTNDVPVISLKREIQETTGLGLTNDHRIYSFYSPENGNAEYGVVIHSPNTGFPDAAAMAAAFQAHPDYNTLPYTITVNGSNTQLVLTFKTDGDFGQRMLQRWGDNGVPLNVLQNGDSNAATIAETNAGLMASGTLNVVDLDRTNTVTVTVASVVASGTTTGLAANNAGLLAMFSVNDPNTVISSTTTTGTITWAFNSGSESFDYLAAGESLTLTYTVRVTDSASVSADRTVTIIIMGTNDPPSDIALSVVAVAENQSSGTVVGNFSTTDADASNTFTYTLVSGTGDTDNAAFQIVGGQLRTNSSFDFETKSSYTIRVRSEDQGGLTFEKIFTITVTNVNDPPTDISLSSASVAENRSSGTVVGNFSTTDADANNTFTCTLVSGTGDTDNAAFQIVGGQLRTNSSFDFETKSSYTIRVRSEDQGALAFEKIFTITVTNVNEAPTNITLSSTSIAENQSSGTVVGNFSTTDVDAGNTFTYTLVSGTGDTDNGSFTISNGQLQTSASFDFEAKSSYTIRVRSTDQGSLNYERPFTITVTDVNEAPTGVSLSNTTTSIAENTNTTTRIKVADIVVSDDALGLETITLTGADASSFEVDGLALYLKSGVSLDYEAKSSYAVTVNVADATLTGSTPVTVNFALSVTDVNEAPTGVSLTNTTTSIAENTSTTTRIKVADIVVADDALGSETITLTGADASSFEVDGLALYLKSGVSLDYEAKSSYAVTVNVADASLTGSTPVTVNFALSVTDVNETPFITVGLGDSAGATLTETNGSISASGTLTVTDPDPSNTVAISVNSVAITGGNFNAANVPLTNSELAAMFTVQSQIPGPSIGSSSSNGVSFLDNQQGGLYVNTTPPGVTGLVSQWKFYKPTPPANDARYLNSWVTPVILEKVGSNYVMRGVGRSRLTTTPGTYTFDFELVSGSAQLANANYTYGHIYRNVNNPNEVLDTRSVGSVGWSTPNGATWGYLQAGLSSTNIGTTYTQISNASRFYASELILNGISSLPADPPAGTSFSWDFNSGSTGNAAFNFLGANHTLELTYTIRSTDSHNPSASQDFQVALLVTGTNDLAVLDLDSSSTNRDQIFTSKLNPISFTAAGTNLSDVDNQTFDNIQISFAKALFQDGANERLLVAGATNGEIATNLGGIGNSVGSFSLSSVTFDYAVAVTNGLATITITGQGGSELTLQQAEQVLDALQYNHLGNFRTSMPSRVFDVKATDGSGLASNVEVLTISVTPTVPVILGGSDDTGRITTDRVTNDTTLTLSGLGGVGDTVTIFSGSTQVGSGVVGANGTFAITTSALSNGIHNLYAVASNSAGLSSSNSTSVSWEISNLQIAQPVLVSNNGLPQVTGTGAVGTVVSVVIGTATYNVPVDSNGNWTVNLSTAVPVSGVAPVIVAGSYPIRVVLTDLAGNASTPLFSTLVVTTPVQPAPVFTSNPSTSDVTPVVSGVCEAGSIITLELRNSSNSLLATYRNITTSSNGIWSVNLETANPQGGNSPIAPLTAGSSYFLSATATDANLQFTSAIATQNLVVDTTAPSQPTITSGSITRDSTPAFTGTAEPGAVVELVIKRGDGTASTRYQTTVDQGGAWSIDLGSVSPTTGFLNVLSDGSYIVEVVAIDASSNRSQAAVLNPLTVDTIAPTVPVVASPALTNDNTPVIAGTAEPGSTITLVIDGFTFTTTAANPGGAWSVDLQTLAPVGGGSTPITALTDGVHSVTVTATDLAGNTSAPANQNLRVDTTAPSIPQITSSDKNNDTTPVIAGLAEPGSTVAVIINNATFNTIAGPNGTWIVDLGTAIPNSGTTPIAPLIVGQPGYPVVVTVTDAAGNTSQSATQNLLVDTNAPDAPVFTSNPLTNQVPPTFTGMAQPGSTVTLTINGATFTTPVNGSGNWTLNTATATLISGNRGTYTDGLYPISIYSTNGFNNRSGTSTQTLAVDLTPPVIIGALASFGGNLNLDESNANAIVSVNIGGIEDGRTVTVTLNGLTYTGIVYSGKVDITIPTAILSNLADGSSQTLTVTTSDLAGNAVTPFLVPFTVDKTGPARPSFASISSSSTDPTPGDRFTSIVNPTVVMSGQPGLTIVITGPNGVVNPSNYTVTETNGLYTIQFITAQPSGDYEVKLRDANGNYNAIGNDAQNYFRIDSIPILFDNPERRSTSMGSTFGNLNIKNILNGQVFNVPQQANSTWIDLDGQTLTFGLAGGTIMQGGLLEVSNNGATLRLDTVTGAYTYTPVPMTDRKDSFLLTVQDTNGNLTQLQLSFNSLDTLDRDGVVGGSESTLAGLITGTGNASNLTGDLNRDGIADSSQNSVTTLAWRTQADFQASIDPNTAANTDRAAIVCMVVNSTIFDPNTTTTLAQLMGNVDPLAQLLQIQVTNTNGMLPDSSSFFKPWDLMNFAVESLVSSGLTDVNPDRPGTQIQVAIDISNANIPIGTSGFTMYRKYITQQTLDDYGQAGITLRDLDNNPVTSGWLDFTQRTPGGDGATFRDFNNDGKLDAIIITLTDNAFGDDSPVRNKIIDPGTPGAPSVPVTTNPGGANPAVPTPPGSNPPVPAFTGFVATGNTLAAISGTSINVFPVGSTTATTSFVPFTGFQGEVRLTRADINNDGTPDIIASMGVGGLPLVRAFDGSNIANKLLEFMAYDQAFSGGVFVAVGDLGHDGILDIVTGAGNGGGPHVKIFNSITGAETSSFMAYDINFRGGVSVAVGDIDGSGFPVIVTGAGKGGGPHVKVFNSTDHSLIKQFMAYATTFSGGVYVAVGDYLSDGKYEIITGAGMGGGPHIKIWDYETLNLDAQTMAFTDFTKDNGEVIDAIFNDGVRVALADANGDNILDILAGAGPTGGPRVEVFAGFRLELLMNFFSGDKKDGRGVFVSQ